jgi:hypothetical protein
LARLPTVPFKLPRSAFPAVLLAIFLLPATLLRAGEAGRVYYQRVAAPELDRFTNSPSRAQQQWFRNHFARMAVFTPYFDKRTSWYPNGLVYVDLYGIPTESPVAREHPDWVLHDAAGNRLYIPWGCHSGVCPQYAADIANAGFRASRIEQIRDVVNRGYRGLWLDDVNMEFRVSDGAGKQVAPLDSGAGRLMTWAEWRNHVAGFVEQIRAAIPRSEIVHNSIWYAGPPGVRDADPAIRRQIAAADNINLERGIANDTGLTGGTGEWSLNALFAFIDRVHATGRGVTFQEYSLDRSSQEYALAGYFLVSSGNDRIGDFDSNPEHWWSGYEVELGEPLGARTWENGVFRREFARGLVLLGEPGLKERTMTLPGRFTNLQNEPVTTIRISARQGVVLLKETNNTSVEQKQAK